MCTHGLELRLYFIPTLRQTKHRERPDAAICVRKSSARRVLQFTPLIGVSSVLHRPVSRVIHRLQSCFQIFTDIFQFIHNINILHFYIYARIKYTRKQYNKKWHGPGLQGLRMFFQREHVCSLYTTQAKASRLLAVMGRSSVTYRHRITLCSQTDFIRNALPAKHKSSQATIVQRYI
jgi:hypothetical protein